jgi:hypothetical protein
MFAGLVRQPRSGEEADGPVSFQDMSFRGNWLVAGLQFVEGVDKC